MPKNLFEYIAAAREKNLSDDEIKNQLLDAGWPPNAVNGAFSLHNLTQENLVPPPVPFNGMWSGFLYILFFIALYVLLCSLAGVFHLWIDTKTPNLTILDNPYLSYIQIDSSTLMRGYIASILISYPIFAMVGFSLKKHLIMNHRVVNIRSRKILLYITLLGSFIIILWNIIGAIFGILSGGVLSNIFENLCVTLLIAGSFFGYFITEVKNDRKNY